jgi:outer membrane protein OmpA-like peptidoglycan-associated protein
MRYYCLSAAFFFISVLSAQQQKKEILVYFDSASHSLSAQEAAKLDTFFIQDSITVKSIALEGFCDDVGEENDNMVLSNDRAKSVSEYIRSSWDVADIRAIGKGEIPLINSADTALERQQNRKVSVAISYTLNPRSPKATVKKTADVDQYVGYKKLGDTLVAGDKLVFRHLIFIASTTVFENAEESESELEKYITYLKQNPQIRFEVHGHVCCISKSFRDARDIYTGKNNLSEARAKRIYEYLIEKGIDKSRMLYKGFGRQFPRLGLDEKFNKRVEIVITQI